MNTHVDSVSISNRIRVLSLDQCFLSELALNRRNESRIAVLKAAILGAVSCGKLVCPAHVQETIFESTLLPERERDRVLAFQNEISCGLAFLSFTDLLGLETLLLVRPTVQIVPYRIQPLRIGKSVDLKKLASENRAAKAAALARADQVPYPPKSYDPNDQLADFFRKVSRERSASMYRITKAILGSGTVNTRRQEWEFAVPVGKFLLQEGIANSECHNLLAKILSHEWEIMPIIGFHTLLWAKIEQDMQKADRVFKVNDQLDILRLAVALQYADAVACDTPMKDAIRQTRLDEAVTVFSMREVSELSEWVAAV